MRKSIKKKLVKRQDADWRKWSNYWKLLRNGSRPSQEDIKIIHKHVYKHLKNTKNPKIVILGSTPEFREMCNVFSAAYGAEVTCIELVDYMHKSMTSLLLQKNKNESVIFCNWLDIKLPDDFADIIIGDLTEGNISPKLLPQYFAEVNRVLKAGGKYITRTTAYPDSSTANPAISLADVENKLQNYKKMVLAGKISVHDAANNFGAELAWDSWYKLKGNSLSISAYSVEIAEIDKIEDEVSQLIVKAFHLIWDSAIAKFWDYYDFKKTLGDYQKYFKDVEYHYANSYPTAKYTPIFIMSKK